MSNHKTMRHSILAARDYRIKPVEVPEWGLGSGLFVRSLSILDGVAFDKATKDLDDAKYAGLYLAYSLCDEDGVRVFDPATDVDEICSKDPEVIARLFHEALHLNQGGKDSDKEREKN
jgi:hypothetical protein